MQRRLCDNLQLSLPQIDYSDLTEKRQFAPEYSQKAYEAAKADEKALGDYISCDE